MNFTHTQHATLRLDLISKIKPFVLFFVLFVFFVPAATAQDFLNKISPELREAMDKAGENDLLDVYLWLTTIDHKAVDDEVEELTGFTESSFDGNNEEFASPADLTPGENEEENQERMRARFQQNARERERRSQNVNRFITERRKIAQREYNNMHRSFGQNHLHGIEIVFQSQLTPMVIIKATKADILRLARVDNVQSLGLYVEEEYVNNSEEHWLVTDLAISLPNAGADYTRNVMGLTGSGIIIGQFENGIAPNTGLLAHVPMTELGPGVPGSNDHAYTVAIVMLSKAGVVPDASLVRGVNQVPTTVQKNGWEAAVLPPHSVHVINQSSALRGETHAHYTDNARWLDYMVANHHVMFVMSTGNENSVANRRMVGNPGTAYNILAVGSLWHNNTVSHHDDVFAEFTNHGTSFGLIKPDVIAPGGGGTSYASPYVAGVVAQMLQHTPELRTQAHLVKAKILASTDRKVLRAGTGGAPATSDPGEVMGQMTPRQGAGVINARNAVNFGGYTGTLAANERQHEIKIPVQANVWTQIALSWFMNISAADLGTSTPADPSHLLTNLDLEVYNSSGELVGSSRHRINNNQLVRFRSTTGGEHTLRVVRHSNNNTVERFALAFPRVESTGQDNIISINRVRVNSWEAAAAGDIFVPSSLFDGNPATFWHARWSDGGGHTRGESFVDIDLGGFHTINKVEIDRRLNSGQNIRLVRMFTHTEQGNVFPNGERIPANFPTNVPQADIDADFAMTGWTELQNQDREITGLNTSNSVILTLNTPITARYIRLGITNGAITGEADFTQVREIRVFGESGGSTSIRNREDSDNRFGILMENAIVSDVARISVITPEQATVNLAILDNLGNVVFTADNVGATALGRPQQTPIVWNLTNQSGRFVANGTYLIVVEATGISGRRYLHSARIGINR